jgi:hypothetical protein
MAVPAPRGEVRTIAATAASDEVRIGSISCERFVGLEPRASKKVAGRVIFGNGDDC